MEDGGTAVAMPMSPVTTLHICGSGHGGSSCNAWVSYDHPPYIWVWSWRMGAQQLQCLGLLCPPSIYFGLVMEDGGTAVAMPWSPVTNRHIFGSGHGGTSCNARPCHSPTGTRCPHPNKLVTHINVKIIAMKVLVTASQGLCAPYPI